LKSSWIDQPDKPEETPGSTLRALIFAAAGKPLSARLAMATELPKLDQQAQDKLASLVERRLEGTPLSHLTGRQNFMGMEMLAGPEALIPRTETEILGREALAITNLLADQRGTVTLMDICAGSGNIALGIAGHESRCRAFGSDLSGEATELARKNALFLGLDKRVEFRQGDMFAAFDSEEFLGKVDIVTCNPPYIPSSKVGTMRTEISEHEPRMAFDGGSIGVSIMARLIREAPKFLKPNSFLCFEVGLGQGNAIARLLSNAKAYCEIRPVLDAAGQTRALVAKS
jgi:release factor glutamine methyltransferase